MKSRKTRYCPFLSGSDGPKDWVQNGKGLWKCLRCNRTGLKVRTRHRSWPPPVLIPAYGDRHGSRNEILAYLQVSPMDAHLGQYKYRLTTNGYGYRQTWRLVKGKYKRVNLFIQREILGLEPGDPIQGHHKDDNPLNNQRWNLEKTTISENNLYKHRTNIRTRVLSPNPW